MQEVRTTMSVELINTPSIRKSKLQYSKCILKFPKDAELRKI